MQSKLATIIRAIGIAASDDVTRPNMCGVYVENSADAVTLTATNGHWLATLELPAASLRGEDGATVTLSDGLYAVKDAASRIDLGVTPENINLGGCNYTNWRAVLENANQTTDERAKEWHMSAGYMADAATVAQKVHKAFGGKMHAAVTFQAPNDDLSPVFMELKTDEYHLRMAAMPMRG